MKPGKIHLQNQFLQHLRLTNPSPQKKEVYKNHVIFCFVEGFSCIFLLRWIFEDAFFFDSCGIDKTFPPGNEFISHHGSYVPNLFFQTSFQGDSFWRISSTIKGTASIPFRFIDFLIEAAMARSVPLPAVSQGFDGSYSCLRVKLIGRGWNCLGIITSLHEPSYDTNDPLKIGEFFLLDSPVLQPLANFRIQIPYQK